MSRCRRTVLPRASRECLSTRSNPVKRIAHNSDTAATLLRRAAFYYAPTFIFREFHFLRLCIYLHYPYIRNATTVVKHHGEFPIRVSASPRDSQRYPVPSRNFIYTPHASLNIRYITVQSWSIVLNCFPRHAFRRRASFPPPPGTTNVKLLFRLKRVRVAVLLLRTLMAAIIMIGIFIAIRNNAEL